MRSGAPVKSLLTLTFLLVASAIVDVGVGIPSRPCHLPLLLFNQSVLFFPSFLFAHPSLSLLPARGATASTARRRSYRDELEHHPVLPLLGVVHAQLHSGPGKPGQRVEVPHLLYLPAVCWPLLLPPPPRRGRRARPL